MNRVAVIGMAGQTAFFTVGRLQEPGETAHATALHTEMGGKGFNQAVAAARSSAEVSFLACVGSDCIAEIRALLEKEGVRTFLVPRDEPSAFAAVETDPEGANRVTVYPGPGLRAEDLDLFREEIARCDVLVLGNEVPESVNLLAASIAKEHGVFVLLNPAPVRPVPSELMDRTDLFTPNELETEGLESARAVLTTMGGNGCRVRTGSFRIGFSPRPFDAADTTGAGDVFNGALAYGIANGRTPAEAIPFAHAAAALSVTRPHVFPAIPFKAETEACLDRMTAEKELIWYETGSIRISEAENGDGIRKAFADKFEMTPEQFRKRYPDWNAFDPERYCFLYHWDKLDERFREVSFQQALEFLESMPGEVLLMDEDAEMRGSYGILADGAKKKGCVARANAKELADRIAFEWYESRRLSMQDSWLDDETLPDDLYVFDEAMEHVLVFTHENDDWEHEVVEPMRVAQTRYCLQFGF